MYSHEDRLRAVELYFKYGKKVVQIVRELGYPSTKQLRSWVQAWQTRDVLVKRVRRKPRYTDMQSMPLWSTTLSKVAAWHLLVERWVIPVTYC